MRQSHNALEKVCFSPILPLSDDSPRRRANHRQLSEHFAELFLSRFARVTDHLINEKDTGAMNDVSAF